VFRRFYHIILHLDISTLFLRTKVKISYETSWLYLEKHPLMWWWTVGQYTQYFLPPFLWLSRDFKSWHIIMTHSSSWHLQRAKHWQRFFSYIEGQGQFIRGCMAQRDHISVVVAACRLSLITAAILSWNVLYSSSRAFWEKYVLSGIVSLMEHSHYLYKTTLL